MFEHVNNLTNATAKRAGRMDNRPLAAMASPASPRHGAGPDETERTRDDRTPFP
jgi:hypothetical protein